MIIRNTRIIDLDRAAVLDPQDILIENGRIKERSPDLPPSTEDEFDASGLYAIPGLVNTHAHTAMTLLRGAAEDVDTESWFNEHIWMYEKNLTPRDVYIGTLLGAAEMLLSGVTWVADHYFHMGEAVRAYEEAGMRATVCEAMFGSGGNPDEILSASRKFVETFAGRNTRIRFCLGPHSPYLCPDDFLRKTVRLSRDLGVAMHIHVSEEEAQVTRSLADRGKTPIRVLEDTGVLTEETILAHAYYATDDDLKLITEKGCGVAHCAKTYMKFANAVDFLPRAMNAGVFLALGSDGPASNNTMNIFETARTAALLAKTASGNPEAAPVEKMLPLLCSGGRILGEPAYGSLHPGAPADIVLLKGVTPTMVPAANIPAHLIYSVSPADIHSVIVDGKIVVKEGKCTTIDLDSVIREVEAIHSRLRVKTSDGPMQLYDN